MLTPAHQLFLKTFGNPRRVALLLDLLKGPKTVTELTKCSGMEQSAVSHNLKRLLRRHKPGLSISELFSSLGISMAKDCVTVDDGQEFCTDGKNRWRMIVNGGERMLDPSYVFKDTDKILFSYGANDTLWETQWQRMSDDACLYSRTCPERGEPPTENCIADPTVPCMAPLGSL